ncbi:hypothetical protein ONZ43_g1110 [Nemania bipapillata]|uniref:Uncharacterized protein n=1 Tax=Nemania bipapillata TaxID=110536 RepID=A0ACC2J5K3_9PEZI|nr:hypothetical protein ONZ43_g1110 [Nemania bipapillata]
MQVLLGEKMFSQSGPPLGKTENSRFWLFRDVKDNEAQKLHQAGQLRTLCRTRFGDGWKIMRVVDACLYSFSFEDQQSLDQVFRDRIIFPLQAAILEDHDKGEEQEESLLRKLFKKDENFTAADTILREITDQQLAVRADRVQGQRMEDGESCRLVKVAVFDAGFDLKDKRLSKRLSLHDPQQPGVVGYYDFVNKPSGNMMDYAHDKHGTEMAGWVMNIMPLAKVYLARVLYGNKANADKEREDVYITEAIKYAVNTWKVDIISMSFAINEGMKPSKALQDAIEQVKSKVSIFAAAGNSRHRAKNSVAYPASPELEQTKTQHIGCIGENLMEPITKTITPSGTSVATAIAAGIGAIVLDFARFCADRSEKEGLVYGVSKDSGEIKRKEVMEQLLWEMTGKNSHTYNLIRPLNLFDLSDPDKWVDRAAGKIDDIINQATDGRF